MQLCLKMVWKKLKHLQKKKIKLFILESAVSYFCEMWLLCSSLITHTAWFLELFDISLKVYEFFFLHLILNYTFTAAFQTLEQWTECWHKILFLHNFSPVNQQILSCPLHSDRNVRYRGCFKTPENTTAASLAHAVQPNLTSQWCIETCMDQVWLSWLYQH